MRVNTTSASSQPFVVAALVDGMGGMKDGSECATKALAAFFNALIRFRQKLPAERLVIAADIANMAVNEYSNGSGGATLSALLVSADQGVLTVNVGDSRIYADVADGFGKKVVRLTVDDSLEEMVGGNGKELLQFLGMGAGLVPHVSVVPENAERILVTSDGIHFIRHETLCDILLNAQDHRQAAEQLITLAKWNGAPDNASLALVSLTMLIKSISSLEETGIEFWDPFGSLHVMWLKHEQVDSPVFPQPPRLRSSEKLMVENVRKSNESPYVQEPGSVADAASLTENQPIVKELSVPPKSSKAKRKSKPYKLPKTPGARARSPQLTIEMVSHISQRKDEEKS